MKVALIYIFGINIVTFLVYGIDKRRAIKDQWRVRERTLFILALLGGSPAAMAGMKCFRHKTKKKRFSIGIPAIMFLQILILVLIKVYLFS